MTNEQRNKTTELRQNNILLYRTTMAIVKIMLNNCIINSTEYSEIDTMISEKYGLSLSVIYR